MDDSITIDPMKIIGDLMDYQTEVMELIKRSNKDNELIKIELLGKSSRFSEISSQIKIVDKKEKERVGLIINQVKNTIIKAIENRANEITNTGLFFDRTIPGITADIGHLHPVTQAIREITEIFSKIGFNRVRYPEIDWDYYAFEALNMPVNHPARDEWETFFIDIPKLLTNNRSKNMKMVLTPHTSNGQVREMEKNILPIRMINIAKCYRRQSDVSHAPMFHQFEGLYVDENVSIAHLKGVCDYFFKAFYGPDRISRLRPFHFQFTEPSFEIDISCAVCHGTGKLEDGKKCRLCKDGWLELGGAGMVHPNVLKAGKINPDKYCGFAFGWGVERTYMMKSGLKIEDVRILYENDIRFLTQF